MAKKLSDKKICNLIDEATKDSIKYTDTKLSKERIEMREYYDGARPKQFHEGSSKYVSMDVYDSVDAMRSEILEAYSAHSKIVRFSPTNADDVPVARAATEYCSFVVYRQNAGESLFYKVIEDGLLGRVGVVKVYSEKYGSTQDVEFEDLSMEELIDELAVSDGDISEYGKDSKGTYNGVYTVDQRGRKVCIQHVAPWNFGIEAMAESIEDAKFCWDRSSETLSDLKKRGYPEDKVDKLSIDDEGGSLSEYERQQHHEGEDTKNRSETQKANNEVWLYEVYMQLDMDKSGTTKLWRIVKSGDQIFEKEVVRRKPYAAFVPQPTSHKFYGRNFAAGVAATQNARTTLIRSIIDHTLITNNARMMVANGTLKNPAELMDNRLGGIVNVKRIDGVAPVPQAPLNPYVYQTIELLDMDKEETTGISKLSQGLNKDAISSQNSQGLVEGMVSNSKQRTKITVRNFGYFLKTLYLLVQQIAAEEIDEEVIISVAGEDVTIDPTDWEERHYVDIELTLSNSERAKEAQKYFHLDQYLTANPKFEQMYQDVNRYEVVKKAIENSGIMDVETFLTPPEKVQPPAPDPMQQLTLEEAKMKVVKAESDMRLAEAKVKLDAIKAEAEKIRADSEAAYKADMMLLEEEKLDWQKHVDEEEIKLSKKTDESKTIVALNGN